MHHHHRAGDRHGVSGINLIMLATLVALGGCGVLSRHHPDHRSIPPLPEECRIDGTEGRRVWLESNRIAGFALGWTEPDSLKPGYPLNSPHDLEPPPDSICLVMRAFARFRAERRLGRNQLLLTLADGTTVRSLDLWLSPGYVSSPFYQIGSVTPVRLEAAADPEMRGRDLFVFVPRWAARQEVVAVERVHDLAMTIVAERTSIPSSAPVCGHVALENRSDQPITLVLDETLNFIHGVLSVTRPDGEIVNCSESGLCIDYAPGEAYFDVPAGGSLRLPFSLLRSDGRMLFDVPGRYLVAFADPSFQLSAGVSVDVSAPSRPEPRYLEFFDRFRGFNGVFSWGERFMAECRAWRDELGPDSEYADAATMIVDYHDGGGSVSSLLGRNYLWQWRIQKPRAVAAMERPRSFNRGLWEFVRASAAAGRPTPVDGAVYYDGCRQF